MFSSRWLLLALILTACLPALGQTLELYVDTVTLWRKDWTLAKACR